MRLRNIPSAREELAASPYVLEEKECGTFRGRWGAAFETLRKSQFPPENVHPEPISPAADESAPAGAVKRPLHIEIGMGKGQFLMELSRRNPDINYIGIENYSSVLVHAVRKLDSLSQACSLLPSGEGRENDGSIPVRNILLLRMNAEYLTDVFAPGEVDRIYLNFSDPWPKDRHARRRLPGRVFLERYAQVLSPGAHVEFKTDNRGLFDFAVEEGQASGWITEACTYDLHHDPVMNEGNILTEYEERFSAKGNPICKLIEHPR